MLPFQRALVTGGAGFIGSHIVDALIREGCDVVILDDFSSGNMANIRGTGLSEKVSIVKGDITDIETVERALKDVEVIFHEAAMVSEPNNIEDQKFVNQVNVDGTLNLLRQVAHHDINRFVFASSVAVYGDLKKSPVKEEHETQPISPYGASKLRAEGYCREFYETCGLKIVILRYFNTYGPRSGNSPYSSIITKFIERLASKEGPVIHGSGKQTRDFVYVEDVVKANILAALSNNAVGKVFNVGSGIPVSLNYLAALLSDLIIGKNVVIPFEYRPQSPGDFDESYADISLIRSQIGFSPSFTIETGLRKHVDYIQTEQTLIPTLEVS